MLFRGRQLGGFNAKVHIKKETMKKIINPGPLPQEAVDMFDSLVLYHILFLTKSVEVALSQTHE